MVSIPFGDARCRPSLLMPLCAAGVVAAGCGGWLHRDAASVRRAMQARQCFSGPLQIQLADAVARGDVSGIEAAVRAGADVNGCSDDGMTMLVWAAVKGSLPGFKALLAHGADLTARIRDPELLARGSWRPTTIDVISTEKDRSFLKAALDSGFDPKLEVDPDFRAP